MLWSNFSVISRPSCLHSTYVCSPAKRGCLSLSAPFCTIPHYAFYCRAAVLCWAGCCRTVIVVELDGFWVSGARSSLWVLLTPTPGVSVRESTCLLICETHTHPAIPAAPLPIERVTSLLTHTHIQTHRWIHVGDRNIDALSIWPTRAFLDVSVCQTVWVVYCLPRRLVTVAASSTWCPAPKQAAAISSQK